MSPTAPKPGLVIFAHGARDARWAEPFLRVAERVRAALPDADVELAFLEFMIPDLGTAVRRLHGNGAREIRIVPLFFGRGGHLRTEVPRLVEEIASALPDASITVASAAGDAEEVVAALAAFCVAEAGRRPAA